MFDFGMPQLDPSMQQPLAAPLNIPTPKKKGGLFGSGSGNIGEAISAALLGALASRGNNPTAQMGLQMLYQRRNDARQQEQAGAERENAFQDFVRREAYKAAHPSPVNNDTVQDYNFWQGVLSPEQFKEYVANKVNPPQLMNIPGVGVVQVPRMGGGMPTSPVGKLTPIDEGGAGPVAPRPFR